MSAFLPALSIPKPDEPKYHITKREVSYWLTMVRRRFQEAVTSVVSETVKDENALQAELRDLFGSGPSGQAPASRV